MLVQSKNLVGAKILSLHTGQPIGQVGEPIINPHKLVIAGFYCYGRWAQARKEPLILLGQDIREVASGGVLINSVDDLTPLSELVRLKEIIDLEYKLLDKPVRTASKRRLGKVDEYVVNTESFVVQKIYVKQSLFKSMSLHSLAIDRTQIIEVTDKFIIVSD